MTISLSQIFFSKNRSFAPIDNAHCFLTGHRERLNGDCIVVLSQRSLRGYQPSWYQSSSADSPATRRNALSFRPREDTVCQYSAATYLRLGRWTPDRETLKTSLRGEKNNSRLIAYPRYPFPLLLARLRYLITFRACEFRRSTRLPSDLCQFYPSS